MHLRASRPPAAATRSTTSVSLFPSRPFLPALPFSTPDRAMTAGCAPLSVRVAPQSDVNAMQISNGGQIEIERYREKERRALREHARMQVHYRRYYPATECTGWRDKRVRRTDWGGRRGREESTPEGDRAREFRARNLLTNLMAVH